MTAYIETSDEALSWGPIPVQGMAGIVYVLKVGLSRPARRVEPFPNGTDVLCIAYWTEYEGAGFEAATLGDVLGYAVQQNIPGVSCFCQGDLVYGEIATFVEAALARNPSAPIAPPVTISENDGQFNPRQLLAQLDEAKPETMTEDESR